MTRIWMALGIFGAMHVFAFGLAFLAARHVKPGVRNGGVRYLFLGERVARQVLTQRGLRLAAIAKATSWIAFAISAFILVFS